MRSLAGTMPGHMPNGGGQLSADYQAGLSQRFSATAMDECRFLETVELLDGRIVTGETDLRGSEDAFLGGERFWGRRVVEIAPVSAWLSSYVAARAGDYVALELPAGLDGKTGWEPLRRAWWFVMGALGLEAQVVHAERDKVPQEVGTFDVSLLPCVLCRSSDPLLTLRRAAELTDDTLVITEPVGAHIEGALDDAEISMIALRPEPMLPAGPRWVLPVPALERLLRQLGFDQQVVTRHEPRRPGQAGHFATIVARRSVPRPHGSSAGAPKSFEQPGPAHAAGTDGLPLPNALERNLVVGTEEADVFLALGRLDLDAMLGALQRGGVDPGGLARVLDFGCSISRVLRHWRILPDLELHGTDVDVAAIAWNRERLGYGAFQMNTLDPKLDYPDDHFGFVYAIAVFNHLPESIQLPWLRELLRVVRPGGHVYFTTFSASHAAQLSPQVWDAMQAGGLMVNGTEQAGRQECAAFHSPEWVIRDMLMPSGAALVDYSPAGLSHPPQDCWLLRKFR